MASPPTVVYGGSTLLQPLADTIGLQLDQVRT